MIKDITGKYLIAENQRTGIKTEKIKNEEEPVKTLNSEGLNKNLDEMNRFFRKDTENFSEITSGKKEVSEEEKKENSPLQGENTTLKNPAGQVASNDMALATSAITSALPSPQAKTINIIYTNDIHGTINPELKKKGPDKGKSMGGVAHMGTVIKDLKEKSKGSSVIVDGGDFAQGGYESGMTKGETMVKVMNKIGYDAVELGNHEFDWSQKDLKNMTEKAEFQVLGANIEQEKPGELGDIKPYKIKEINGVKVGILGLITPDTTEKAKGKNLEGVNIKDPKEIAEKYIKEMKKEGVDLVVALTHQGIDKDKELAQSVKGIDVIVGGHSHTGTEKPEEVNGTLIVQGGSKGESVGNLQLDIDPETKKIRSFKNELIPVNAGEIKPDPEVEKIIKPVLEEAEKKKAEIIGTTSVDLSHNRDEVKETILGNVITDGMREKTGSDIALINSRGIKAPVKKGNITAGDIHNALPYESKIVTMELTGAQIRELMENSAGREDNNLQVSGMSMDIDRSKPPGEKVSNLKIGGVEINQEKTYLVSVDDFLSTGGDNYDTFAEGKNKKSGSFLTDALKDYIKENPGLKNDPYNTGKRLNYKN